MDDVTNHRQNNDVALIGEFGALLHQRETQYDDLFRSTCRRIAVGYAMYRNTLQSTGRVTFRTAMRCYPNFRALPHEQREEFFREMKYIKKIYEGWEIMVHNCTLSCMSSVDVRTYKLWKLARCVKYEYVEEENIRNSAVRPSRRVEPSYFMYMVDDIVNNVGGSTDRLLSHISHDPEQIKLIAKDFHDKLLSRGNQN